MRGRGADYQEDGKRPEEPEHGDLKIAAEKAREPLVASGEELDILGRFDICLFFRHFARPFRAATVATWRLKDIDGWRAAIEVPWRPPIARVEQRHPSQC